MYVIKSRYWIEDYYQIENLYEDVIYKNYETAFNKMIEISKTVDNSYFTEYLNSPLIVLRGFGYEDENTLEELETDGNFFLTIQKLEVI